MPEFDEHITRLQAFASKKMWGSGSVRDSVDWAVQLIREQNIRLDAQANTISQFLEELKRQAAEIQRQLSALKRIAALPDRYGYFQGHDAAVEAIRIAREAIAPASHGLPEDALTKDTKPEHGSMVQPDPGVLHDEPILDGKARSPRAYRITLTQKGRHGRASESRRDRCLR